jgi:DNA-binding LacI/PurR family transcriptional regulator
MGTMDAEPVASVVAAGASRPMPPEGKRAGVREVAARAGVSAQTVSRVINDSPHMRPETRARVVAAMSDLGYRVNNAARSLGTSTTRTLGVLALDAMLYGPSVAVAHLESAARSSGRWIATAYADAGDAATVSSAVDRLLTLGVDGIVVLAPQVETLEVAQEAAGDVRVALMHSGIGAERQAEGAALLIDHLVSLGHRRIARVRGPRKWFEADDRDRGMRSALDAAGMASSPQWTGDWSAASGYALAPEIAAAVRSAEGPTAVAVANDQMALGLMAGLDAAGIAVPTDVSVTGFDDNPDAAFYRPSLTTVRIDLPGEARRVLAQALELTDPAPPLPPLLLARESSAAPSSAANRRRR